MLAFAEDIAFWVGGQSSSILVNKYSKEDVVGGYSILLFWFQSSSVATTPAVSKAEITVWHNTCHNSDKCFYDNESPSESKLFAEKNTTLKGVLLNGNYLLPGGIFAYIVELHAIRKYLGKIASFLATVENCTTVLKLPLQCGASWNCHMQLWTPFVVVVILFMLRLCCFVPLHNEPQLSLVVFHNLWHLWAAMEDDEQKKLWKL